MNYSIVFDPIYYAANNPDVKNALGTDENKLLQHFINYGMDEGRQATLLFDVSYYKNKYEDLRKAFGSDLKQYYLHYINNGCKEKRYGSKLYEEHKLTAKYQNKDYSLVYDGLYYVQKYPDLKKAFGYDEAKLIKHFVTSGMKEGRQAKPTFNLECYKNNYPDLQEAFGATNKSYYLHYINNGYKENRIADQLIDTGAYRYSDSTASIEIIKELYQKVNVYVAHLKFTDYTRFKTYYHPSATASKVASLTGAIFCVNGSAAKLNGSGEMHSGVIPDFSKDKYCTPALYSQKNGKFFAGLNSKYQNMKLSQLASSGIATDTFGFGPALIKDGVVKIAQGGSKRPRTFIGTNEKAGDIWIAVAQGDGINGNGPGLTGYDCAQLLKSKGCTLAYPLDGGGSSTMYFKGGLLNTPSEKGVERGYLGDFVYFK